MTYKDAFAKIKEATGIASITEMVEEFVRSEDQNFALFNVSCYPLNLIFNNTEYI